MSGMSENIVFGSVALIFLLFPHVSPLVGWKGCWMVRWLIGLLVGRLIGLVGGSVGLS